ncbi:MAG: replicative DNA helicase [Deltaproteobacteria bacterium]|jgi:replicative DNA helicase|nr:replicative DNA helicase [Deltaproteobacteria bacterium]
MQSQHSSPFQRTNKLTNRQWKNPPNSVFTAEDGTALTEEDPSAALKEQAEADILRNVPPHSVEAEQAVLGGVFLTPDVLDELNSLINAEDFYLPAHRIIYTACRTLMDKNAPVDIVSVNTFLKDQGLLEEAGGSEYIASLAHNILSSARADYFAGIVRDKSQLRALISSCSGIISRCFEPGEETKTLLDESEKAILAVGERRSEKTYQRSAVMVDEVFEQIHLRAKNKLVLTGLNSGYTGINTMTGGFQNSDLIIIAARPAMGKTAFAMNIAMRAAGIQSSHPGVPVAVFSLEMSSSQLIERMLCVRGSVDLTRLRKNQLEDDDWAALTIAADDLSRAEIFIDDTPALSIMDLRSRARRLHRKEGVRLVVVDYLQLMRASPRIDSREQQIAEISRGLKAMAKELNIPVIALSQLSRKLEERKGDDKKPLLSDLRESGAIEQDADVVMFIHRDSVYQKLDPPPQADRAEIIFGKHRNGKIGSIWLVYKPAFTLFEDDRPMINAAYADSI